MLIPVYHIIASQFPIAASTAFEQGHVVALDTNGYAIKKDTGSTYYAIGLAGDKNRPAVAEEWQNRVSDMGNETAASGMMTVYKNGGEFWVDIDDDTIETPDGTNIDGVIDVAATVTPGTPLYRSGSVAGHLGSSSSGPTIAVVVSLSQELTTGIPGEFEPGSSFPLVDDTDNRNFVKISLLI